MAAVDVERAAGPDLQLPDAVGLADEVPRGTARGEKPGRREIEDAMAVPAELRRELLGPLKPEVEVDDREDDRIVAAGGLHRHGVGLSSLLRVGRARQLDQRLALDRSDDAPQPARERPRHQLRADGEERRSGSGRAADAVAEAPEPVAETPEARGLPALELGDGRLQVLFARFRDSPLPLELALERADALGHDPLAHRDLAAEKVDAFLLLADDSVEPADLAHARGNISPSPPAGGEGWGEGGEGGTGIRSIASFNARYRISQVFSRASARRRGRGSTPDPRGPRPRAPS